jgi:hypothetical protein
MIHGASSEMSGSDGMLPVNCSRDRQCQGEVEGSGALLGRKLKYYPVGHA